MLQFLMGECRFRSLSCLYAFVPLSRSVFGYFLFLVAVSPCLYAQSTYSPWWIERGVITTNSAVTNDYALLNAGQLKWLVTQAAKELDLHGGAGEAISNYVSNFSLSNNFVVVKKGQLKYAASLFYDRIAQTAGKPVVYPWSAAALNMNDYAPANVGQAKNLFCFQWTENGWDSDAIRAAWTSGADTASSLLFSAIPLQSCSKSRGDVLISILVPPGFTSLSSAQCEWDRFYLSSSPGMAGGWTATNLQMKIGNSAPTNFPAGDSIDITDLVRQALGSSFPVQIVYTRRRNDKIGPACLCSSMESRCQF